MFFTKYPNLSDCHTSRKSVKGYFKLSMAKIELQRGERGTPYTDLRMHIDIQALFCSLTNIQMNQSSVLTTLHEYFPFSFPKLS